MSQPLAPYPDYKPAGLPWLDKVPAHWEVVSNRKVFAERKDRGHTGEELLSVTISRGVIRQSDLIKNTSKKDSSNEDKSKYKLVLPGDFAYNKMRMWQGAVGYSDFRGIVSPAYIVLEPIAAIDVKYYHYLMRTPAYVEESHRYSYGICDDQLSLRFEDFRVIKTLLPPLLEQQRIVAFLDGKTRQIAGLLRNKRQLIKLLTEQKQALIHRTVTQGLDADAPRKDSGVAWLGEVPAHWKIIPLKHLATNIQNGATPPSEETIYFEEGTVPWYGPGSFKGKLELSSPVKFLAEIAFTNGKARRIRTNSLLFIVIGATVGKSGLLLNEGSCNQQVTAFELNLKIIDKEFAGIQAQLFEQYLRSQALNATIPILSSGLLNRTLLVVPPLNEQLEIVARVKAQSLLLDQTISRAEREIELIQEYRTRLIADAVTGQVDVRHLSVTAVLNNVADLLDEETGEEESEEELLLETEDGRD